MRTRLVLHDVDLAEATALDWSVTDHSDDEESVHAEVWMSLPVPDETHPSTYGTVYVTKGGLVQWVLWAPTGLFIEAGSSPDQTTARRTVESLLAERNAR